MTERRNDNEHNARRDHPDGNLEALYRKAGDVEPDAGLDRIIRARAQEAGRTGDSSSRLPWLSGLVTASVAIVAIAVVLQEAPPGEPLSESLAPPDASEEPAAFMAPSMGAQSQQDVSTDARRALPEIQAEDALSARENQLHMREAQPQAAGEPRQQSEAEAKAAPAAPPREDDEGALDRITVTGTLITSDDAALWPEDAVIGKLRELIEAGRIEAARQLRERAIERHPKLELPDDIERALRKTDSAGPEAGPGPNRDY